MTDSYYSVKHTMNCQCKADGVVAQTAEVNYICGC